MSDSNLVVCKNCGNAKNQYEYEEYTYGCEAAAEHDWSHCNPLARALARVESSSAMGMEVDDYEDNADWQWFEVELTDHDTRGASEAAETSASHEGFSFVGCDVNEDGNVVIGFNRKKGE